MREPFRLYGLADTDTAIRENARIIRCSAEYRRMPAHLQEFIDLQLGSSVRIERHTPCSALLAKKRSAASLLMAVRNFYNPLLDLPPEPYFATFAFTNGEVGLGNPLRNVQTTIDQASAALRSVGLEGVLHVDIDLLRPSPKGHPICAFHLHGIFVTHRSSRRKLRLKRTQEVMAEYIGWPSRLGDGVDLTGKRTDAHFRLQVENMATYAGKVTAAAKVGSFTADGKAKLKRRRDCLTGRDALCMLYAWSQIPLLGSVVPVGQFGRDLHQAWRAGLARRHHTDPHEITLTRADLALWNSVLHYVA